MWSKPEREKIKEMKTITIQKCKERIEIETLFTVDHNSIAHGIWSDYF